MMRRFATVILCVLLAGCAPLRVPEPPPDHPARPEAAAATETELSDVLAVDEANLPQRPSEMQQGGMMHGGHGEMDAGSPMGAEGDD